MTMCTQCEKEVKRVYKIESNNGDYFRLCPSCMDDHKETILNRIKNKGWYAEDERTQRYMEQYEEEVNKENRDKKGEEIIARTFHELNQMIGLGEVKNQLKEWVEQLKGRKMLEQDNRIQLTQMPMHMTITGSPGTGKTVLARKITEILYAAGFIPQNKLTEVQMEDIVGQHVGHTGPKTRGKIEEAMGGVFFLDEAYRLAGDGLEGSKSGFGIEALETLMVAMENHSDKIVFIFAGYEDKMKKLLAMNEGLPSRIPNHFKLNDYTPSELSLIGKQMLESKGYDLSKVSDTLQLCIENKANNGVLAGNARTIRTLCDQIRMKHMVRIGKEKPENILEILPKDILLIENKSAEEKEGLRDIFEASQIELENMIGLGEIKQEVKRLGNFQLVQQKRKEKGMKIQKKSNHMFFKGNPGTGKTTVARIVGKVLRGAGVLSNGHLVEVTKNDLTDGGKTTKKVKEMVQKALGGVLFIDEAYTLASSQEGHEALDMLIKEMEEHRENLVVIFAGYTHDMEDLLTLNEGLLSRVPNHFIFEDYKASELVNIMFQLVQKNEYVLSSDAKQTLVEKFNDLHKAGYTKGNGRWVRNFFEKLLVAQSVRIIEEDSDELTRIEEIDILDVVCELEFKEMEQEGKQKNKKERKENEKIYHFLEKIQENFEQEKLKHA